MKKSRIISRTPETVAQVCIREQRSIDVRLLKVSPCRGAHSAAQSTVVTIVMDKLANIPQ